jgi:hypothetical protein
MVKPSGPYAECLQKQLDNPEENVAFSIRAFTNDSMMNGSKAKVVLDALTYDFVTEPGIKVATKFKSTGLEELINSFTISPEDLDKAIKCVSHSGLENEQNSLVMVKESLGWNKVKTINLRAVDWV